MGSCLGTLLSGINVFPAKVEIYKPVSNGIMDTRLRGQDGQSVYVLSPYMSRRA